MKKIYLSLISVALAFAGCANKVDPPVEPTFAVSSDNAVVFVQEGVHFSISGHADFVTFYSGEKGNDYAFRDKERIYEGECFLSFASAFQAGQQYKNQTESDPLDKLVSMWWSDDFSGEYTEEAINAATWHDMTGLFTWPSARVDNARDVKLNTDAGTVNLADIFTDGIPQKFFFAYRYKVDILDEDGLNGRSKAVVSGFKINNVCAEAMVNEAVVSQGESLWTLVNIGFEDIEATNLPVNNAAYIYFNCGQATNVPKLCWAVSKPISLNSQVNTGCDYGTGIKSFSEDDLTTYSYTFANPGVYDVHFVATNVSRDGRMSTKDNSVKVTVVDQGGASIDDPTIKPW